MGSIHRVWDADLRRHLAMKIALGTGVLQGVEAQKSLGRFLDEAQITGQLDHPGVVPVHDLGIDEEGNVFFTMRLVRGRDANSLFRLVRDETEGWTVTRAVGMLLRASEALAFAHDRGVVHRDLKPANLMVGRFGEVYVMDWGLAHVQGQDDAHDLRIRDPRPDSLSAIQTDRRSGDSDPDSPLYTMDGDVVGTPAYMAPEQARGELESLGPATDVYAMGAILYELLAGERPYSRSGGPKVSPYTIWRWVLEGPPQPIAELAGHQPPELLAICEKAMAREIEDRYPDMQALADDLRAYLENRVVQAHRTGAWVELRKWVERNRSVAASLAALVVVLAGGAWMVWRAERGKSVAERQVVAKELEKERGLRTAAESVERATRLRMVGELLREAEGLHPLGRDALADARTERWLREASLVLDLRPVVEADVQAAQESEGIVVREDLPAEVTRLRSLREAFNDVLLLKLAERDRDGATMDERTEAEIHFPILEAEIEYLDRRIDALLADFVPRVALTTPAKQLEYDRLRSQLQGLRQLGRRQGQLRAELGLSRQLRDEAEGGQAGWQEVCAQVSETWSLELLPQTGLRPLREDPHSGLWEFLVVASGDAPEVGIDGRYVLTPATGIVLVLLPGGSTWVGVQGSDPSALRYEAGVQSFEGPPFEIHLSPFLISKYELTQAQYLRLTGENPSTYFAGQDYQSSLPLSRTHPVESVSALEAEAALAAWGLVLPSGAQFEYAARAGVDGPFYWGDTFDAAWVNGSGTEVRPTGEQVFDPSVDTFPFHAPVDSFPPNPFGLYCVLGNVQELTADGHTPTLDDVRAIRTTGTGVVRTEWGAERVVRGGGHNDGPFYLRVSHREPIGDDTRASDTGIRACWNLTP